MVTPSSKPWTYEDYCLIPEDGKRYEIIDGELFMTSAPKTRHQDLVREFIVAIQTCVRTGSGGKVLAAPCDVFLTETNLVQPDVLYVSAERASIITEANIQGAPDLTIEILSESTRKQDEVYKRNLYERFGVQEYWIVDPELETVKVYRLDAESRAYGDATVLSVEKKDRLSTTLLAELDLSLADLFFTD